jgi:hypothetical protein
MIIIGGFQQKKTTTLERKEEAITELAEENRLDENSFL